MHGQLGPCAIPNLNSQGSNRSGIAFWAATRERVFLGENAKHVHADLAILAHQLLL